MKIVAVLDTMWGHREGRSPRYFRINPYNRSGSLLYSLVGSLHDLYVTNVCPQMVTSAKQFGVPDVNWLKQNLERLRPEIILVCGKRAQKTFLEAGYKEEANVLFMPHPAARMWTSQLLDRWRTKFDKKVKENCNVVL